MHDELHMRIADLEEQIAELEKENKKLKAEIRLPVKTVAGAENSPDIRIDKH